ncbi:MAG: acyl-CoA dehydrogenase family protein [Myxococcales bacterium]|nr:acyl-CoA dehydrogenase family protein [Myxococcales bacterium]
MNFDLAAGEREWIEVLGAFAREAVAPGAEERNERRIFSRELWRTLAEMGLMGLTIPAAEGGRGVGYLPFALALETLTAQGHDVGLTVSWMIHCLLTDFHLRGLGSADQRARYLPKLISGDWVLAFAVSEPEVGAHPKHMRARAEREGDGWRLNATKTFVTNGPVADLFIVFAQTGDRPDGRKAISAFLVPARSAGVDPSEALDLPMARSSPHGTIHFRDVRVPATNLIGEEGSAYERVTKQFRELEDSFALPMMAGHFAWTLELLGDRLRGDAAAGAASGEFGLALACRDGMETLGRKLAWLRDHGRAGADAFSRTLFAAGTLAGEARAAISRVAEAAPAEPGTPLARALDDMALLSIGRGAERRRLERFGARALEG